MVCQVLFLSSLHGFSNSYPSVRPYVIWTWCRLDFCQVSSRTTYILLEEVSFNKVNLVKPVHESDRILFPSTFQQSSIRFSCATSKSVWIDLMTSIYFSGIRNDSSLGTYGSTLGSTWWRWMKFSWKDQKSFRASASSFDSSGWNSSLSPWDSPLRLSLRWIPVSEWVLGIRSLFLIINNQIALPVRGVCALFLGAWCVRCSREDVSFLGSALHPVSVWQRPSASVSARWHIPRPEHTHIASQEQHTHTRHASSRTTHTHHHASKDIHHASPRTTHIHHHAPKEQHTHHIPPIMTHTTITTIIQSGEAPF